jgi:hypothetical protein
MKIEFSPRSLLQLNLFMKLKQSEAGFVCGFSAGQYRIIDGFFPLRFNKNSINRVYPEIFNHFRDCLLGVFFVNAPVFLNDWFLEQLIIDVQDQAAEISLYQFDDMSHQKRLVPITEKWRG